MLETGAGEGGEKPLLRYYQNLRMNANLSYNTDPTSQIVEVELLNSSTSNTNNNTKSGQRIRLMHLAQIVPLTALTPFYVYMDVPALLALKHFNARSNLVVPDLSEKLQGCNLYMTMDLLNSQLNPVAASAKIYSYFRNLDEHSLQSPQPAGVLGAIFSSISRPLSILTSAYEIPQISPGSTAGSLDNPDLGPTFGRTIPTNAGDAAASAAYLAHLGLSHFGILFVRDDYGISFEKDLAQAAQSRGLGVVSVAYQNGSHSSLERALNILKDADIRYIYAILPVSTFRNVLEQAFDAGLIGNDYAWLMPELDELRTPGYSLDRIRDAKFVAAIHGVSVVNIHIHAHPGFKESISSLRTDPDFQSFFLESHVDKTLYNETNLTELPTFISQFSATAYDAAMALGIAACQSEEYFIQGPHFFEQFKETTFDGASGSVSFDTITGTRKFDTLAYAVTNVFIDEELSTNATVVFKNRISTLVDFGSDQVVNELYPTIYHDGTSTPPPPLPSLEVDMNLVPLSVFAVGWILSGLLILSCFGLGIWVIRNRKNQVVRSSQPLFLLMMLAGTVLMAGSIIPMTFQEPTSQKGLDIACMLTPWMLVCGFATAFSAIFTKAWRISIVVEEARNMHQTTVTPSDVLLPFLMLTAANILLLTFWTAKSPLVWTRFMVDRLDPFGRSMESYARCQGRLDADGSDFTYVFAPLLAILNFFVLAVAFYQSYLTRRMPSQFNEARHMSLSMGIILEAFILGVPMLFVVGNTPTAYFLVRLLLISSFCIGVLGPNFIPKLWIQRQTGNAKSAMMREWGDFMAQSSNGRTSDIDHTDESRGRGKHASAALHSKYRVQQSSHLQHHGPSNSMPSSVAELRASIASKSMTVPPSSLPSSVAELRLSASLRSNHNSSHASQKLYSSGLDLISAAIVEDSYEQSS